MFYFISDLHFGHKNALAFDNRPFRTIEEHDEFLIKNWNDTVNVDDEVWILGDISWYNVTKTIEIYKRLNGVKHLCVGNHDHKFLKNEEFRSLFAEIVPYKELSIGDIDLVMCHFPMPAFNRQFHGAIHLYGHVHTGFEWNMMERFRWEMENLHGKECNMYNVGCMVPGMDFTPRRLDEIIEIGRKNYLNFVVQETAE